MTEELICYCFNFTVTDIEQDALAHGHSTILAKILAEKKAGGCQCATKNPKGRGCLADVRRVADTVQQMRGLTISVSPQGEERGKNWRGNDALANIKVGALSG